MWLGHLKLINHGSNDFVDVGKVVGEGVGGHVDLCVGVMIDGNCEVNEFAIQFLFPLLH